MIKVIHKTIPFFFKMEFGVYVLLLFVFPFLCLGNTDDVANEVISRLNLYGNSEKIWFIPGWKASTTQVGEYMNLLKAIYKSPIYILNWDSNQSWNN